MLDPERGEDFFILSSEQATHDVRSPRILGGRLTRSTFRRLGRGGEAEEEEEEDICRRDDSAREGEEEGIGTTDGIRSGRERKGARIADGVGWCRGDEMALGKGKEGERGIVPNIALISCSSPHFPGAVRCEAGDDGNASGRMRL